MTGSLEDRFVRFLRSLPNSEEIDALSPAKESAKGRRADYLLAGRQVILELKTLNKDTSHKVAAELEKQSLRDDYPVFYGERELQKVLDALPDGGEIHKRIYDAITRSIEKDVRSAEEQITETRKLFTLPNSVGLLVILNESIEVLDPTVVASRVSQLLGRVRTGRSAADKVDFVWLILESHSVQGLGRQRVHPNVLIIGEGGERYPWFRGFHADMQSRWAAFNNAARIDGGDDIAGLRYISSKQEAAAPATQLPLHEVWRLKYRSRPVLRSKSDNEVLEFGGDLLARILPSILVGGTGFDKDRDLPLMEMFTGFIEEMNFRGLDMRRVPRPPIPDHSR